MRRERRSSWGWFGRGLLLAPVLYAALWAWSGHRVGQAEAAWREARHDEAHEILSRALFWRVRGGRVNDALGVVDLSRGRLEEAASHLAAARRGFFHPDAFGEDRVLTVFMKEGRLESARLYAEHRARIHETPATLFYLGAAEDALNRLDDAEKHLAAASIGAAPLLRERIAEHRKRIAGKRRTGRADYLFDRNGAPLAGIDLKTGRSVVVAGAGVEGLLAGARGPRIEPRDLAGIVTLSLDLETQRAAESALGEQRGALVVLDPRDGAVLAAASNPPAVSGPGGPVPPALARTYEPGSIMKMVTLAGALRAGIDIDAMFPFDCAGWIAIDGIAFRDWTTHRRIETIDEAAAVSCNLVFGRLGQLLGRDRLNAELRRFGFDYRSEGTGRPGADFGFDVGAMLAEDGSHPDYALARKAEGLDSLEITPMGAAVVAAGLARGGSPPVPWMVREKLDPLREVLYRREDAAPPQDPLPAGAAGIITRVMQAAVSRESGTARRAAVEGLDLAMKTGTSGTNPPGYDALMIGFAPSRSPRIAWALVAEHAGKSELEGARITREFLRRIQERLR